MPKDRKKIKQAKKRRQKAKVAQLSIPEKNYYDLKGKNAEAVLHELAEKTFLSDWCYPNPQLPDGNELCDLLVVFDDIAIIWQVKDVKLQGEQIRKSDFDKNLKQISGAYRQLFELKTEIELSNPRRGKEKFEPSKIKKIYLISAFLGDSPFIISSMHKIKGNRVHTFTREFTQIALNELDTILDFTNYLKDKEQFNLQTKSLIIEGGEEELLGHYLKNNRSFDELTRKSSDIICVGGGMWEDFIQRPEYIAKKKADEISYFWDFLIDICHTGDSPEYEYIARELAKLIRFDRRNIASAFIEHRINSDKVGDGLSGRRTICLNGVTYCFLCHGDSSNTKSRESRKMQLSVFCNIARGKYQENQKVVGIATDQKIQPQTAYDFCFINQPEWSDEDQKIMELNMRDTGILSNPTKKHRHYEEYPQV